MASAVLEGDISSPSHSHDGGARSLPLALAPDVRVTASAHGSLVYRRSTGLIARVGPIEWEVLRRFDGKDIDDIRAALERDCGFRVTSADLAVFARRAFASGLLVQPGSMSLQRPRRRGLSWSVGLWNPERLFTWCAPRASRLFHPLAVSAALLLILAAVAMPAPDAALPRLSAWYHLMVFVVMLNLVSILHECGHGIALHHYGGSAREIGIRFVLGWPCWYCDITESYLLPRLRQRLAVIIAGPFAQAAACAFLVLLARSPEPHVIVLRRTAALLGVLSLLNFFPLIRSDGYYLLTELAGMPNLRTDAWRWLTSAGARLEMRRKFSRTRRIGVAAYGLASAAFLTIVLTRAVVAIGRAFAGTGRVSLHTVEAVLSVVIIVTMIPRRRSV